MERLDSSIEPWKYGEIFDDIGSRRSRKLLELSSDFYLIYLALGELADLKHTIDIFRRQKLPEWTSLDSSDTPPTEIIMRKGSPPLPMEKLQSYMREALSSRSGKVKNYSDARWPHSGQSPRSDQKQTIHVPPTIHENSPLVGYNALGAAPNYQIAPPQSSYYPVPSQYGQYDHWHVPVQSFPPQLPSYMRETLTSRSGGVNSYSDARWPHSGQSPRSNQKQTSHVPPTIHENRPLVGYNVPGAAPNYQIAPPQPSYYPLPSQYGHWHVPVQSPPSQLPSSMREMLTSRSDGVNSYSDARWPRSGQSPRSNQKKASHTPPTIHENRPLVGYNAPGVTPNDQIAPPQSPYYPLPSQYGHWHVPVQSPPSQQDAPYPYLAKAPPSALSRTSSGSTENDSVGGNHTNNGMKVHHRSNAQVAPRVNNTSIVHKQNLYVTSPPGHQSSESLFNKSHPLLKQNFLRGSAVGEENKDVRSFTTGNYPNLQKGLSDMMESQVYDHSQTAQSLGDPSLLPLIKRNYNIRETTQ